MHFIVYALRGALADSSSRFNGRCSWLCMPREGIAKASGRLDDFYVKMVALLG